MFCGKCGKELADGILFCPDCGTKTNNIPSSTVAYTKPKIPFKKVRNIIISLLVVFAIVFSGIKIIGYIQSVPSDEELRLASNNSMNGGLAATDGRWLFYFGIDDEGLCREKLTNGKNRKVIIPERFEGELFFLGDKVYAGHSFNFTTVKANGKDLYELPDTTSCEKNFKTNGKTIFFRPFDPDYPDGVCSQKFNGDDVKQVFDMVTSEILYYKDSLYLLSGFGKVNDLPNEDYGVVKVDTDGKNPQRIFDDLCPDYFVFDEDKIYYTNDGFLYRMNLDGSEQEQFGTIEVGNGLNVSNGYIYYVDEEDSYIHKVSIDDPLSNTVLNNQESENINIVGDWIVYENLEDDSAIYKMKNDGSENRFLSRYE